MNPESFSQCFRLIKNLLCHFAFHCYIANLCIDQANRLLFLRSCSTNSSRACNLYKLTKRHVTFQRSPPRECRLSRQILKLKKKISIKTRSNGIRDKNPTKAMYFQAPDLRRLKFNVVSMSYQQDSTSWRFGPQFNEYGCISSFICV